MTPDEVGFYANANNQGGPNLPAGITLLSWSQT
jgi:hypothetical protein